ncbi:cysteine synthase CysM [Sinimarinibacterium flocculans]|uniref:Cysteine synthase n=1 Tax=Sinimarinibacterium flocculans TaxID=985250 RepID=A0A318EK89_9GAMM|nr:cysteine synthase CysM [Sinimarinibacterium flocculans]PXV71495.1 cysteine synthase [Sinimarinibacterium flocculans]
MSYPTLADFIGNTPLAQLKRLPGIGSNTLLVKLEGNNPAGSVKDRPAYSMIRRAEERGDIKPGDVLIEATSGNTGIALAMAATVKGYKLKLIMPEHLSVERRAVMKAFGAEVILVTQRQGMEGARDLALQMQAQGQGKVLDQFGNPDNPRAHYEGTAPEIWKATQGRITHFVSSMGTTGTIMGCSRYFKEQSEAVQIVGVQPDGESSIPGIRKWPEAYLPKIFEAERVDRVIEVSAKDAEDTMRLAGTVEGLFCGPSSGGALWAALQVCKQVENATIVTIVCDRGDRYISTGVFPS